MDKADLTQDHPRAGIIALARNLLREAIRAVPAIRYFLGVVGAAAAASLVGALFFYTWRVAFVGTVILFVGAIAVVIFANLSKLERRFWHVPALILTWLTIVLFTSTAICLFTSVFFAVPLDLREWLLQPTSVVGKDPATSAPAPQSAAEICRTVGIDPYEIFLVHTAALEKGSNVWTLHITVETRDIADLQKVREVRYILHPTFNPSEEVRTATGDRFALDINAWGEFMLRAQVYFHGHQHPIELTRFLNFTVSDDSQRK
jgi:uncharacterized membrane protein YeaQ/YmgE (transglycosylase-associated protein family)